MEQVEDKLRLLLNQLSMMEVRLHQMESKYVNHDASIDNLEQELIVLQAKVEELRLRMI